jgi:hypothetical protein
MSVLSEKEMYNIVGSLIQKGCAFYDTTITYAGW